MSAIVLRGDASHLPLPDESVDLLLCSPPYWGQRDYKDDGQSLEGQIGNEEEPGEYLARLWECTREWARVLKPSGSIFVNLDDSYYSGRGSPGPNGMDHKQKARRGWVRPLDRGGLKFVPRKSLLGLPGLYASGCTGALAALGGPDHGLHLTRRADIVWRKNGVPESVRDRAPREHEQVFHFTRRARYYSACDEIREPLAAPDRRAGASAFGGRNAHHQRSATGEYDGQNPLGRIPGTVWDIPTEPLVIPGRIAHARCCGGREQPGCEDGLRHDAAWPTALVRRIVLGWSPPGICLECGEGRYPVSSSVRMLDGHPRDDLPAWASPDALRRLPGGAGHGRFATDRRIARYACACPGISAPTRPAVVVDPFGGIGTTPLVAAALGRIGIGVDLSMDYARLARWRTRDPRERARALGVPKPPPVPEGQASLFDEAI